MRLILTLMDLLRCCSKVQSCNKIFKNNVDLNDVISTRIICSSYLPNGENADYVIYSSKRMGGGVSLDLIHEIDYILYLFGKPEKIVNYRKSFKFRNRLRRS